MSRSRSRTLVAVAIAVVSVAVALSHSVHARTPLVEGTAATVTAVPTPAPSGTVLASDNFSDPSNGLMPKSTFDTTNCHRGYSNGQYELAKTNPQSSTQCIATVRGAYPDASISVDVGFSPTQDNNPQEFINLACREPQGPLPSYTHYEGHFLPMQGKGQLLRHDVAGTSAISNLGSLPTTPELGHIFHLQMICDGNQLWFLCDGTVLGYAQDPTLTGSQVSFYVGDDALPGTVDVFLANLVLTQP